MEFRDIPIPEVYKQSMDFRFFLEWFSACLSKLQYDTENMIDLLDPERCPKQLLWMLCDTFGYKYDDRLLPAYNRMVLLYFMSMIRNRGSRAGVTIAAELNLAQFAINDYAQEDKKYEDALKDTVIPVNSAYVSEHTDEGYIDIVYYSEKNPVDATLEYVRPLGMYCFSRPGVRFDARTKVSVDARLTDSNNINMDIGPTRVGHYRRADYASLQPMVNEDGQPDVKPRNLSYYRNSDYERVPSINAGLRSISSLQLCNNEHIVKALIPQTLFYLGKERSDINTVNPESYYKDKDRKFWNLLYDNDAESMYNGDVQVLDLNRPQEPDRPRPAVNPKMSAVGDALSMNISNTQYVMQGTDGRLHVEDIIPDNPSDEAAEDDPEE